MSKDEINSFSVLASQTFTYLLYTYTVTVLLRYACMHVYSMYVFLPVCLQQSSVCSAGPGSIQSDPLQLLHFSPHITTPVCSSEIYMIIIINTFLLSGVLLTLLFCV